ncbi:MAG: circadian clock protein KaiB [Bacteroidetes bacterium]|nr:circadian clock protein KaiB [Bacteroidota bacterium]
MKIVKGKIDKDTYILHLFIAGTTSNATRAILNIKKICTQYLKGRFELHVIDIYQQPKKLVSEQITAIPVLVRKFPLPEKILIGDLSDYEQVLKGLNITIDVKEEVA